MNPLDQQLLDACRNGDVLTVEKLLQQGANPNSRADQWPKPTPLLIASENGHAPIIALLIQYGADLSITDSRDRNALHYAAKNQRHDTIQYLISQLKFDPNAQDQFGQTAFMIATQEGNIAILRPLVQLGANPHAPDKNDRTALHYAVEKGNHLITEYLITELQLDPNTQDQRGFTPFMIATLNGDIKMLQLLTQLGANPYITDHIGQTALAHAVEKSDHHTVQYLITQLNITPNTQDRWRIPPFLIAARKGDIDMLRLLAQLGANPHATDQKGRTALHYVAFDDHHQAAQYLITQLQLDPNTQDHEGDTPLLLAIERRNIRTTQTLIQLGADPHIRCYRGRTAIHCAAEQGLTEIIHSLIIHSSPDLNIQDHEGNTPLLLAFQKDHTDTAQALIQLGANPHLTNSDEKNILYYAVQKGDHHTTQSLITQLGLDPNIQDHEGKTLFMLAAENGDIDMLKGLIRLGAAPHTTDQNGRNALHHAVEKGHYDAAQYLITQLKLDPNTQDRHGITPLMIATSDGDIKMLRLLIQLGANPHLTNSEGKNILYYAVPKGDHHTTQYLLTQLQLDPNIQDQRGVTPFMIAAENGDIKMLKLLIQLGANPYATDHQGRNALHYATKYRTPQTASFLITHLHLDPNSQDHQGNTPLILAMRKKNKPTIKTLIQLGATPHIPNHQGYTISSLTRLFPIRLEKPKPSPITL